MLETMRITVRIVFLFRLFRVFLHRYRHCTFAMKLLLHTFCHADNLLQILGICHNDMYFHPPHLLSSGRARGPPVVVAFSVFYDTFLQKNISAVSSSDKSRTSDILNISIRVKSLIPLVFFDHEDFEILTSDRNSPTEYPFIFILAISKFLFTSLSNVPHLRLCLLRYFHIITHSPSCKSFWTLFFSFVQFC